MSHSHSHAPGQTHSHSPSPQPQGAPQAQAQKYVPPPPPDPKLQALIEADFKPVTLKLGPLPPPLGKEDSPKNCQALCVPHGLEKCDQCSLNFGVTNNLARLFAANPNLVCPPPPQIVQPQRSQAVTKTKEEGNALFKANKVKEAIAMYSMAVNVASQRLPWEPNNLMKEELATVLSNRSAAFHAAGDYLSALVDAELVIQLKRPWSKGHFRKAKALVGLGHLPDAREAIRLGLAFEPNNTELQNFLDETDSRIEREKA